MICVTCGFCVAEFSNILGLLGARLRGNSRLRSKQSGGCGTRTSCGCLDTVLRATKGTSLSDKLNCCIR